MGTGQYGRKRKQARKYVSNIPNVMKHSFLKEIELPQEQDVLPTIKSDQDEHVKVQNKLINFNW